MSYLSEYTMDMAHDRAVDDANFLPVTGADILPKKMFERVVRGATQYPLAKARLDRHCRALLLK